MKANPSKSWKNEIQEVVEHHDFGLDHVYDAGRGFRHDDTCRCDFCGTPLRYTAVVEAEDDEDITYEVGLDCLEHTMGTGWSHLQDVERKIKNLKEEAKKQRRKEEYAKEYPRVISWLEERLEIEEDSFLRSMYEILTTGEKKFSKRMRDSVADNIVNTDLDVLREKQKRLSDWESRLESLLDVIIKKDAIKIPEDSDKDYPSKVEIGRPIDEGRSSYSFVQDVLMFLRRQNRLTENQMDALDNVANDYSEREVWEEDKEEVQEEDKLPF